MCDNQANEAALIQEVHFFICHEAVLVAVARPNRVCLQLGCNKLSVNMDCRILDETLICEESARQSRSMHSVCCDHVASEE